MGWADLVGEAFSKPGSRRIRLALSLLFISLATAILMIIFQSAKMILDPDITLLESHLYTIVFICVMAPIIALLVLLRFEKLYEKITEENRERKRAGEALRESEEKFRVLFERASMAIFVADVATGRIIDCNEMAEELTGRSRDEIIGLHQTQLHPADRTGVQREQFARHVKGIIFNNDEAKVVHRDGRVIPVIVNEAPLTVNGRDIMIGFFLDITERKRAEEALKKDRYILAKSQEVAHVGNWAWNLQTGEITGSAENYRIFGYKPEEVRPTLEWVLSLVHPDDRASMADFMGSRARDGIQGNIDYRVMQPDGSVKYVNTIVDKAVCDKSGKVKRLYGISQDITGRKRAEEALSEAKQQAELYLDLMGHDINNMHQIALGYLELAREMPASALNDEMIDKSIEVLQRSAQLIKNVRKLQKLNDGMFRMHDVDVTEVLSDLQHEFSGVPGKTVILKLNGCGHCHVRANELLHDVFANLVSNAIKHTGNRANIDISLDLINGNGGLHCRVSVEDNGPGVPDDFKPTIFNRMLKGTRNAKGMGLGLYLVKSLVDSYGGRVWIEDRVFGDHTKGARFVVMLPAVDN